MAGEPRDHSSRVASHLLVVGIVLYVLSWFAPAARWQEFGSAAAAGSMGMGTPPKPTADYLDAPCWLPGWNACRFAWHLLVDSDDTTPGEELRRRLVGSTCLTNVVMVLALLAMAVGGRRRWHGLLLLGCAGIDASWIYLIDHNPFEAWGPGYFMWLVSFALVGAGLCAERRA